MAETVLLKRATERLHDAASALSRKQRCGM